MGKDIQMQAYIDGELSTSEATEFESSLSQRERDRLTAERQVEDVYFRSHRPTSGLPGCCLESHDSGHRIR